MRFDEDDDLSISDAATLHDLLEIKGEARHLRAENEQLKGYLRQLPRYFDHWPFDFSSSTTCCLAGLFFGLVLLLIPAAVAKYFVIDAYWLYFWYALAVAWFVAVPLTFAAAGALLSGKVEEAVNFEPEVPADAAQAGGTSKGDAGGVPREVVEGSGTPEPGGAAQAGKIIAAIRQFKPARRYRQEAEYRAELVGFLKHKFPNRPVAIEEQIGSSRPDITMSDVAIEVKGPTDSNALRTVADKCLRYSHHYQKLVVVLFTIVATDDYVSEWSGGMKLHFPNVEVIAWP